jgi:transcriptional regulator with XRE-family HTH domain
MEEEMTELTNLWTASDGKALIEKRLDLDLSRRELAELTSLTQSRVWRVEHMASFDTDTDRSDAATIFAALKKFAADHPDGKPSRAKSTKSTSTGAGVQLAFLTSQVAQTISTIDTVTIPALKTKKVSTAHLVELSMHLRRLLEDTEKVTA